MKQISLSRGLVALVDDEDYDHLNQYSWSALPAPAGPQYGWYAKTNIRTTSGKFTTALMHRMLLSADPSVHVDHENGNGLDNQKHNLRTCTRSNNMANRTKRKASASVHKGVTWNARKGKWIARISHQGKRHHLGEFANEHKAAQAYNQKARELFGEFARLNNPQEDQPA